MANGIVSTSGHDSPLHVDPCGIPDPRQHINGSECNVKIQVSDEEPLHDNPASNNTQKSVQESVTDRGKLNGSTVTAVTTNDQTCSLKKPTSVSQEGT